MSKLPNHRFVSANRLLKRNKVSPPGKTGGGTLPSPQSSCRQPAGKTWRSDRIKRSRFALSYGFELANLRPRFDFCDHSSTPISQLTHHDFPKDSKGKPLELISSQANNLLHRPTTALKSDDQSKSIKESELRKIPRSLVGRGVATITDKREKT